MSIARKIAIAAGAATLAAGGVAGAVAVPDAAEDGLTKAGENVGQELPASKDSHPTKDQHPGMTAEGNDLEADVEVEDPEAPEEEEGNEEGGPVGNHGAAVSAVAHATESGPGKGAIVSEVARSDAGKPEQGAKPDDDDEGDDEGGEAEG